MGHYTWHTRMAVYYLCNIGEETGLIISATIFKKLPLFTIVILLKKINPLFIKRFNILLLIIHPS